MTRSIIAPFSKFSKEGDTIADCSRDLEYRAKPVPRRPRGDQATSMR